jgi:hypothetical protein
MSTADSAGTATPRPSRWVRAHSVCQRRSHPSSSLSMVAWPIRPSTSMRMAAAPPLTEKVNPVPVPPSASVTVTCTISSSLTPKPAHRVPVGTRTKAVSSAVIWVPIG